MWQIALDAYAAEAEIAKVGSGVRGRGGIRQHHVPLVGATQFLLLLPEKQEEEEEEQLLAGMSSWMNGHGQVFHFACLEADTDRKAEATSDNTKKWRKPEKVKVFYPLSTYFDSSLSLCLSLLL